MMNTVLLLASGMAGAHGFSLGATSARLVQRARGAASIQMNAFEDLLQSLQPKEKAFEGPVMMGTEEMMSPKAHGTSDVPVQKDLRWNCDPKLADSVCNFNRHYAENAGYWERGTTFLKEEQMTEGEITFYDPNTGLPLFYGPRNRSWDKFVLESKQHGWPSFRDEEVNWEHVRVLPNGECISTAGTHLGHNLPDRSGNRYCINLVSIAGRPAGGPVPRVTGPDA
mmetsp:Transcript_39882/g.68439  ORF Transcript_39882/g.68439 Transcript_39882/m.68439 type:complete len:225 (-) Transcript_39882:425-1099(-)